MSAQKNSVEKKSGRGVERFGLVRSRITKFKTSGGAHLQGASVTTPELASARQSTIFGASRGYDSKKIVV